MCGIAGILDLRGRSPDAVLLKRMNTLQAHRGPDGEGCFVRQNVGLGHRRLSIIDHQSGGQPMSNEAGDVWLTYNGEIYNYRELRCELQRLGHRFASRSDSEVIVHAYEQWGDACVLRFRGMFAFAIADFRRDRLFLARDHFGIKPLFYRVEREFIAFASELAPLTLMSRPEIDLQSLDYYLRFRYIPAPRTIYQNVLALPPAHRWSCSFAGNAASTQSYWSVPVVSSRPSTRFDAEGSEQDSWADAFESVLQDSVEAHLESDVPVGAFLSGGVDSTLIVSQLAKKRPGDVHAFSIGFRDADYSELRYAQHAASQLGIQLHTEIVEPDVVGIFQELFSRYGQPFADTSAVPTWCVAKLAREHVATVLSGDGADEAFAGYTRYHRWMHDTAWRDMRRVLKHPKQAWRRFRCWLRHTDGDRLQRWQTSQVGVMDRSLRAELWRGDLRYLIDNPSSAFTHAHRRALHLDPLSYAQSIDLHTYLPGDILTKIDTATMCHGLEARTPFTDVRMMQFAAQLSSRQRFGVPHRSHNLKALPKRVLARQFSNDFVYREKQGFAIPESAWLQAGCEIRSCFDDVVSHPHAQVRQYFNGDVIDRMVQQFDRHGRQPTALWLLMILGLWLEHHAASHDHRAAA